MVETQLYKYGSRGETRTIIIKTFEDKYEVHFGVLNGKMQIKTTYPKIKNVGKKNESTIAEQSIKESKALVTKKIKSGYSLNPACDSKIQLPMKVSVYQDHKAKLKWPVFVSLKLNGINCEYRFDDNHELVLLSRGGESYPIPEHQRQDVTNLMKHLGTDSLNGEMYIHGEHLQDLMAATKKPNELSTQLKFWVFDFPHIEGDYNARCTYAYAKAANFFGESVHFINVSTANSHEELDEHHKTATDAGYEGIIIRNPKGMYLYNTRSLDVFKYKLALDAEFRVTGFKLDKNNHAVYTAETASGGVFSVKRRGTSGERLADAQDAPSNIGKWLTVEFETYSKSNIPLKPVGLGFRKCDSNGNPAE